MIMPLTTSSCPTAWSSPSASRCLTSPVRFTPSGYSQPSGSSKRLSRRSGHGAAGDPGRVLAPVKPGAGLAEQGDEGVNLVGGVIGNEVGKNSDNRNYDNRNRAYDNRNDGRRYDNRYPERYDSNGRRY